MNETQSKDLRFRWLGIAPDGKSVTLTRYDGEFQAPAFATEDWFLQNPDLWRTAIVVDVETTGRNGAIDKIIEIGVRSFRFHRHTGEALSRGEAYGALQDPAEKLSPEITRITGIRDEDLAGKQIDWDRVASLFDQAQVVIAHNAAFDRPFLDRYLSISSKKIWACSYRQIDWVSRGFPTQKLEVLAIYHGFFCCAHRALADADALLHLLAMPAPLTQEPYLKELFENARKRYACVVAENSPIETKDKLKEHGYRWNVQRRVWSKMLYAEESEQEVEWLKVNVYGGTFRGSVRELNLTDNFKALD